MCGWKKTTANRRQAESRVKQAWLCRGAKEEDEVNRRITSGRIRNHNMRDTAKYEKMG